ncbi:fasciclin domain-containing protein [Pontibacter russatus]|uniref:fasciclin domain-containing protein n=1 Tax=Pontibacter russatus TaxID=2694929 RepID=UPI00137B1C5F|nr:fasciclin domain-containing protein [Pontibacter russatus]
MRELYHRLYRKLAVLALLLALGQPLLAQEAAKRITLMQYVMQERPVLAELVTKAGLTPVLSGDAPYTILAPPEAELAKLKDLPPVRIRAVLLGHILEGVFQEKDFKDGATLETLAHTSITVCRKKDYTLIDGLRISGDKAQAKNGVVHSLSGKLNL